MRRELKGVHTTYNDKVRYDAETCEMTLRRLDGNLDVLIDVNRKLTRIGVGILGATSLGTDKFLLEFAGETRTFIEDFLYKRGVSTGEGAVLFYLAQDSDDLVMTLELLARLVM